MTIHPRSCCCVAVSGAGSIPTNQRHIGNVSTIAMTTQVVSSNRARLMKRILCGVQVLQSAIWNSQRVYCSAGSELRNASMPALVLTPRQNVGVATSSETGNLLFSICDQAIFLPTAHGCHGPSDRHF